MKKLSSLLLAILMVLTLSVPALGADITKEFEGAAESVNTIRIAKSKELSFS